MKSRRFLAVEDGPTITHGGMSYGAGYVAAAAAGADGGRPRPWLTGGLQGVFARYPHIGPVLPAVGYRKDRLDDLARTIDRVDAACVVIATSTDLTARLKFPG